jgi:hypothetical protein
MITELICYKCKCSKCNHLWTTKGNDLPKACPNPKCKRITWNDDFDFSKSPVSIPNPEPIQAPVIEKKTVLNALQAKIDGITDTPKQIVVDDNWIEMPTTIENGETLYWHRKIKGSPVCYKRETNWDTFA